MEALATSQVVATIFQTIAAANDYWRWGNARPLSPAAPELRVTGNCPYVYVTVT
ncbi:hexameric tyrosine-coordinated heme protein [Tsukamurella ocularis]|uniref:hexameric tyrosine-coordinated heme protein n=1 Tax=Tsukamurella ocularis TaxID=1970234 RepID=UPI0035B5C015